MGRWSRAGAQCVHANQDNEPLGDAHRRFHHESTDVEMEPGPVAKASLHSGAMQEPRKAGTVVRR